MFARRKLLAAGLAAACLAGLAGAALLLFRRSGREQPLAIPVRVIVGDLLSRSPEWEVLRSNTKQEPDVRVITPSDDYRLDGADMPALAMPPPAEVRFRVPDDAGDVALVARAGVDHTSFKKTRSARGVTAVLSVDVDGASVFREAIPVGRGSEPRGWSDVGGPEGLKLSAGQEVVLRTELLRADGEPFPDPVALQAGFGGCLLEQVRWRPRAPATLERPNVVLIVMDTERADRLSAYGYGLPTSPRLEELAARGLLFENAQSTASWTWPSTASILTGLLPEEHGVVDDDSCYLAHGLMTLAEVLQLEGVTTAAWSANPLVVPEKNFDQGFELFASADGFRKSDEFLGEVDDFLERTGDRRFLLYLHLTDPHDPQAPSARAKEEIAPGVPEGLERKLAELNSAFLRGGGFTEDGAIATEQLLPGVEQEEIQRLYDACVRTGDLALGRVMDALERLGLSDRTLIAYTADHGEELFEHGLIQHGSSLYQESVRVPLVLAGPGVPAGVRVSAPVSNRHLSPTLARLARTELPLGSDALDLVSLAASPAAAEPDVLFSTRHGWWNGVFRQPLYGLRSGDWVLHWAPEGLPWGVKKKDPGASPGQRRLFDLRADPLEREDLAGREPERADELQARLEAMVKALEDRRTAPALEAGAATLKLLQDVGYLDAVDGTDRGQ
jgi:arylsulfatase A-like enzyme